MRSKFKWIYALLVALTMQFSFAQQKTVTGKVTGEDGSLPGANVKIVGTNQSVSTGFDGSFTIKAKEGDVLEASFVGAPSKTMTVGAGNVINFKLVGGQSIDVVYITQGYKTVSKKQAFTGSSNVSGKTIENRPNANAMNTLQGQISGVNITATTGQPGAKSTVVIRGVGSISGNSDPLYVIDGFPSNSDNFRSINSNDIASVEVLKDAIATSEYGSRGSNGVIVIKTRKASFGEGKTVYRYSTQYGLTNLQTPRYSYANAQQLLQLENNYGIGQGATLTQTQIDNYNGPNTDWVNYFFKTGTSSNNNFSIENSGKNVNSFTSLSYFTQDGILNTTGLQRFTLRNNLNGKSNDDKFKYYVNTAVGHSVNREATNLNGGAINRNYVTGAYLGAPYLSPSDYVSGPQIYNLYAASGSSLLYTPLFLVDKLNNYKNQTEETRFDVATEASYKLLEGLTGRVRTSGQLLSNRFFQSEFPDSFNGLLFSSTVGVPSTSGGSFNGFEDVNQRREFLFNNLWSLDYTKKITDHTFNLTGNAEYNYSNVQTNNIRQRGLDIKTFVPNTGAGYIADQAANDFYGQQASASRLENTLISYFGSFNYDYNSKYGIAASVRRDGSSRFIGDKQWGTFWSLGARWNLEEEEFIKKLEFVNVFKIRGSIGTVGNQRIVDGTVFAGINPPGFADIYSGANNAYNGGPGYNINFGYPDLRWETTKQWSAGFDAELFKGRLRATYDYYNRLTIDQFIQEPVSSMVGTTAITKNSDATVTNKGYELNLAYDLIKNKDLTLTVRGNGSFNQNSVGGIRANGGILTNVVNGVTYVTQNGGTINEPLIYPYLGVNQANGELLYQNINGVSTETITAADRRTDGRNNLPKYQGGFGLDLDYKGFFASTSFTFIQKVYRFESDLANLYDPTNLGTFNVGTYLLNAWTPTNTNTDVPSLNAVNLGVADQSDRFLQDASYVRLRNAQIGYRVPKKVLEKTFIKDLSFTLQGENLFTITKWQGFDAEGTIRDDFYGYPTSKIFTFGVDLKF